ncbi:hypothetical protein ACGFNU_43795 [Spirillospora sp. NPDC048911]|uniref:hypothetical protein n=1 Tax=Spirillospora sp. NPDC048911 TaxID=3364527 RepID=UPI00370F92A5
MAGEASQRTMLLLAVEVVRAAYEEALLKHGLLPSTVALIHSYAEENLAALDEPTTVSSGAAVVPVKDGHEI